MKFVCSVCGYVYEGDAAPEKCPVCGAPAEKFTQQSGDMAWAAEHVVGVAKGVSQEILDGLGISYTAAQDQATALLEVQSGTADAAVIDYLMAAAMTGEGTSYEGLTYAVSLNDEQYGVG